MENTQQREKKYNEKKWKKIMDTTQNNYANMLKRLTRKKKLSNFVLIYYSIFLIINTLTGKYFSSYFNPIFSEYFGIILSVVMLAYSIINSNANYEVRIVNIESALNKLKTIKRQLCEENLQDCIDRYNKITDSTERREDVDFYITIKHFCKEYEINLLTKKHKKEFFDSKNKSREDYNDQEEAVKNYLSEINVVFEQGKIFFGYLWPIILFVIPVLIFVLCVITSSKVGFVKLV